MASHITYNPKTQLLTVYNHDMDIIGEISKEDPQFNQACKDCRLLPDYARYFIQYMEDQ